MAITRSQQARQMLKKGTKPVEQAGVMNYMPSEMVTVPKVAKSSPDHPTAKLAYITDAEKKLLIKKNLHGSLKGKPNRGPGGIPSLQGDFGPGGKDPGGFRGGADIQSAETGDFRGFDGSPPVELPPGVKQKGSKEAQDLRSAFIAAGGGQRVNPGFFDSRNVISPQELALAKAFNPTAFRKGRNQGIFSFLGSGGLFGNLIRGIGRRLGLGKRFDEPTYDMRRFSNLGLFEPSINPVFDDGSNEDLLSIISDANTVAPQKVNTKGIVTLQPDNILANTGDAFNYLDFDAEDLLGGTPTPKKSKPTINKNIIQDDFIDSLPNDVADNLMAELSQKQLNYLNSPKGKSDLELLGPRAVFEDRLPLYEDKPFFGSDQEPTTKDEFNEYLRSIGSTQIV